MKAQHTPGEWVAISKRKRGRKYYEHGEEITVGAYDPSFFGIAKVGGPANYNMQETMRANARLIASAPELLEACKAVLDMNIEIDMEYAPAFKAALDKVTAAIAKAEGKEG
jgi:hypothetical protein